MENKNFTIKDVIFRDMDTLIVSKIKNENNISINDLIDISSYLAANLFRQRWKQNNEISQEEINIILGNIGDFCNDNFGEDFTQKDFDKIVKMSHKLLQNPTFDADSKEFFDNILNNK